MIFCKKYFCENKILAEFPEVIKMVDNSYANKSIKCTVTSCENHNDSQNYCALDSITVGTHEVNPTECKCTDCENFVAKCTC